jgi:hypothetical protein
VLRHATAPRSEKGPRAYGNPMDARFPGVGDVNGEKWVYDYGGYLVPDWPDGVNQVAVIVSSVIRTFPHSGGKALAGVACSFYAVKQG